MQGTQLTPESTTAMPRNMRGRQVSKMSQFHIHIRNFFFKFYIYLSIYLSIYIYIVYDSTIQAASSLKTTTKSYLEERLFYVIMLQRYYTSVVICTWTCQVHHASGAAFVLVLVTWYDRVDSIYPVSYVRELGGVLLMQKQRSLPLRVIKGSFG